MKAATTTTAAVILAASLLATAVPATANETGAPNDGFEGATEVGTWPFQDRVSTQGATLDAEEPQPSCSSIDGSLWYRFTPVSEMVIDAHVSAGAWTALGIYSGRSLSELTAIGCAVGTSLDKRFSATESLTYFIQIGSAEPRRSFVDLDLVPNTWREKTLFTYTRDVAIGDSDEPLLSVEGQPRLSDGSHYDVTVEVMGRGETTGIFTSGLVRKPFLVRVERLPINAARFETEISYRYDRGQYQCAAGGDDGASCAAHVPVKDLKWLARQGHKAELVVTVRVLTNHSAVVTERTIVVPFAGQVVGIL